eukprot:CAMPEP_0174738356 /NCGR_PEP_ID=MMETSP1094-20130205/69812_1 /TAXON_ID=156173 /ORGANISM="Chrysochromulina brevifilum, Strain UTEX LB 985" /LENGTH=78 /DNA_ID=CAMNT_0015941749 /DNA_START=161 /DNA_END=397 /DNA_ORIENTATION=-
MPSLRMAAHAPVDCKAVTPAFGPTAQCRPCTIQALILWSDLALWDAWLDLHPSETMARLAQCTAPPLPASPLLYKAQS